MEEFKQILSDLHQDLKQISSDYYQTFIQDMQDIVENTRSKMCHQVEDVEDEIEEFKSDRKDFFKTEIGIFIEMLGEEWIMQLEKSRGKSDLQAINKVDLLVERTWNFGGG